MEISGEFDNNKRIKYIDQSDLRAELKVFNQFPEQDDAANFSKYQEKPCQDDIKKNVVACKSRAEAENELAHGRIDRIEFGRIEVFIEKMYYSQ